MRAYIENNPPVNFFGYLFGLLPNGSMYKDILLTSRGRDAIQLAVDFLGLKESDAVLLPALTCDTVSSVFSSNCQTMFYDLNEDYSIDIRVLENFLETNSDIKLIYVIHYFGFIHRNISEISSLCRKYGVILVEDHAHSALSNFNREYSDIQIFSFRKLLPTADGGGINFGKQSISHDFNLKKKFKANQKGLLIALKRVGSLYSSKFRSFIGQVIRKDIDQISIGTSRIEPLPISVFGRGIIQSANIDRISKIRKEQYELWKKIISQTPFGIPFPDLSEETVPFGFPIRLQNPSKIVEHFKQYNIFLKVNWTFLPAGTRDSCPISHQLVESSVTLPIYPGLKNEHMYFIGEELKKHGIPLRETTKSLLK